MSRTRVLIVDDDPTFRSLLVAAMRRDHLVSVAVSGEEAFEKAIEWNPDAIILDQEMGDGWDGVETLQKFRQHFLLKSVPVIMCTADSSRATVLSALEADATDYVVKTSFSADVLLAKVTRAVSKTAPV
jgi:two-component system alkaline phosphatase synthesis response regulator PhoP